METLMHAGGILLGVAAVVLLGERIVNWVSRLKEEDGWDGGERRSLPMCPAPECIGMLNTTVTRLKQISDSLKDLHDWHHNRKTPEEVGEKLLTSLVDVASVMTRTMERQDKLIDQNQATHIELSNVSHAVTDLVVEIRRANGKH